MNSKTHLDSLYQSVYEYCGREIRKSYKSNPELGDGFLATKEGQAFSVIYNRIDKMEASCGSRGVFEHCFGSLNPSDVAAGTIVHTAICDSVYKSEEVCFVTYGFDREPSFGLINKSQCSPDEWKNDLFELIAQSITQRMVYIARKVINEEIGSESDRTAMSEIGIATGTVIKNVYIGGQKSSRIEVTGVEHINSRIMVSYKLFKRGTRNHWVGTSTAGKIHNAIRNRDVLDFASNNSRGIAIDFTSDSHPQLAIL